MPPECNRIETSTPARGFDEVRTTWIYLFFRGSRSAGIFSNLIFDFLRDRTLRVRVRVSNVGARTLNVLSMIL